MPDPKERYSAPASAYQTLGTMPHCDGSVLHAPGKCEYCDMNPEWQALRQVWRINFSDENDPQKTPCPSTMDRPASVINKWGGNVARPGEPQPVRETSWEKINRDHDDL